MAIPIRHYDMQKINFEIDEFCKSEPIPDYKATMTIHKVTCSKCNEQYWNVETTKTYSGDILCLDCAEAYYKEYK